MTSGLESDGPDDSDELDGTEADFGFGRTSLASPGHGAGADPFIGVILGDVLLERFIAEGGMGRVYLGRQARPNRWVAVKVLKPGIFSTAALRRFERESDVLGQLHHPGITQVHAFGTFTVGGMETAYSVLEYVAGSQTITAYADIHNLPLRQCLILFRDVCDAVTHAHSRGVLHRDLKPGNILISAEGRPKIIDFGIAQQLDHDTIFTTAHDEQGALIGTVQYMAPEQFHGDGSHLDVRVDVYALGVVLYELLCRKPPFDLQRKALAEAARTVLDDEPRPFEMPIGTLERDVELVIRKCLEKAPRDRYASVVHLGADVDRCLRREPLSVRPPSVAAKLRRLLRRHHTTTTFLAGTLTVLALLGLGAVTRRLFAPPPPTGAIPASSAESPATALPLSLAERRVLDEADIAPLEPLNGWLTITAQALTEAGARAAARKEGHLTIEIASIDTAVARALATHREELTIKGPKLLPAEVAAEFGLFRGRVLGLDSLEEISPAVAASLAGIPGWLNLNGVQRWAPGALETIARHEGGMCVRVEGLSAEQAAVLGKHRGFLYLTGVKHLDAAMARALVEHEGGLELSEVKGITAEAADLLRRHRETRVIRFNEH